MGITKNKKSSFAIFAVFASAFFAFLTSGFAYATSSISIGSNGNVDLGNITPSASSGIASNVASDNVTISTNCTAGYSIYATGVNGGNTALEDSTHNTSIPTSSNTITSPAALANNTWGLAAGTVGSSSVPEDFSGLPAYTTSFSSISPLYIASSDTTNPVRNDTIPVYYGIKVDTDTVPGSYATSVLYTAVMNDSCLRYSLTFDGNSATTNNLTTQTVPFGGSVDLSTFSSTDKIARTGYHLTGWKVRINGSTSDTVHATNASIVPDDGTSSEVTLVAQWQPNTYTINYAAGSTGGSCSSASSTPATYDSNVTLASSGCSKSGYYYLRGWSTNSSGSSKTYSLGQTLTKPNLTATDGGSYTLYPYFVYDPPTTYTLTVSGGIIGTSGSTTSGSYTAGSSVTIKANSPSTGYHFSYWSSNNGGSFASTYSSSTTFTMPSNSVTVTANNARNSFTLYYDANGGSGTTSSQTVTYGTNVTLRSNNFTPPANKKFKQWGTSTSGGTTYSAGASVSPTTLKSNITTTNGGSVTLYAIWEDDVLVCSSTVHPGIGSANACKMPNYGGEWFYGNNGNTTTWSSDISSMCSGGTVPSESDYKLLIGAENRGDEIQLYSLLGLSESRGFWSSTEHNSSRAASMIVFDAYATTDSSDKSNRGYILCYK